MIYAPKRKIRAIMLMTYLGTGLLVGSLGGCVPILIGAGAAAVGGAAADERGIGGTVSDTEIRTRIAYLWHQHDAPMGRMLSLSVREGRALITGTVDTDAQHMEAIRLAWQAKGVKEVIDEIKVSTKKESLGDASRDAWITTKLNSLMLFDKDIASRNFNIKTISAVVYIMGVAQNHQELNRVLHHARTISGVRRVVSYARIKDSTPVRPSESATSNSPTDLAPAPTGVGPTGLTL